MENNTGTSAGLTQAVIENILLLKDGSLVAGCYLLSGSVKEGARLYYTDGIGRQCFPLTISGIVIPGKGGVPEAAAGEKGVHLAFRIADVTIDKLHVGHLLQSEPEELWYEEAPGWDAITERFAVLYPEQKKPLHFGTYAGFKAGEAGPLDGINVYNGKDFFHFVTLGLSELYEKQNGNSERSGYGFELTLKLKKEGLQNPALEIRHVCSLLQMLAGVTVNHGHQYLPGQCLATGMPKGFDAMQKSALTCFVTKEDELGVIATPFGRVQLVQVIGITDAEMERVKKKELTPQQLAEQIPGGLTDYQRA